MKTLASVVVLLCVFSICQFAYATRQIPDIITVEDESFFTWGFYVSPEMEQKQKEFISRPQKFPI